MPQKEARDEAIRRARERLAIDLESGDESVARRCSRLGLPEAADGFLEFPLFGTPARLELSTLDLTDVSGEERSQTDRILFYHYFAVSGAVTPGGELISFRDLTGGSFYWEPFRSRTCIPLASRYGDHLPGLRAALARFDWSELELGDFGARIHGIGNLSLSLVAYAAEEGIEAEIIVLFDPAIKRVYQAEDAVAFASRICLAML
jgi:hypothetical protein